MAVISRLKSAEISNGNIINADDIGAELNQLVAESNSQDGRLTTLESGATTLSGVKTFASIPVLPAGNPTSANEATRKGYVDARTPTGVVLPFAGSSAPTDWLLCYGQAISRTSYGDLFALLGTTYGAGDGSTTFNLPDLRGRTVIGKDDMGGSAASRITSASTGGGNATTLGGSGGAQTHTLSSGEMPTHSHTASYTANTSAGGGSSMAHASGGSGGSNISISSTGGGGAHNNTQPWMALNYIIRT